MLIRLRDGFCAVDQVAGSSRPTARCRSIIALDDGVDSVVVHKRKVHIYPLFEHAANNPVFNAFPKRGRIPERSRRARRQETLTCRHFSRWGLRDDLRLIIVSYLVIVSYLAAVL